MISKTYLQGHVPCSIKLQQQDREHLRCSPGDEWKKETQHAYVSNTILPSEEQNLIVGDNVGAHGDHYTRCIQKNYEFH